MQTTRTTIAASRADRILTNGAVFVCASLISLAMHPIWNPTSATAEQPILTPIIILATPTLGVPPTAEPPTQEQAGEIGAPAIYAPPTPEPTQAAPQLAVQSDSAPASSNDQAGEAPAQVAPEPAAPEKNWISPDSYALPGSKLVYYVDSNGQVVDVRLPGSEDWLKDAPAEEPTAAPVAPPAPTPAFKVCGGRTRVCNP